MNIFITGGTGFLGEEFIKRLINQGHSIVMCVRDEQKAAHFLEHHAQQVTVLVGNVTEPLLGFDEACFHQLQGTIDIFYHFAADVRFNQTLDALLRTNYFGTEQALKVAISLGCKAFYYVSTAYTVGKRNYGVEKLYTLDGQFNNYYEQSKCQAEHLVHSYKDQIKTCIFRPAIVIGDSQSGKANTRYSIYALLYQLAKLRDSLGPNTVQYQINEADKINLIPVDYVCDTLLAALYFAETGEIYNLVVDNPTTSYAFLEIVKNALAFENLEWITQFKQELTLEEQKLKDTLSVFEPYLNHNIHFDNHNTLTLLKNAGVKPLPYNLDMLQRIVYAKKDEYARIPNKV